ncbi:MAG TPA: AMP-binding protein [Stellaceae bacterium]|nr:AMP-binding protein [Stellaceae bacterium]
MSTRSDIASEAYPLIRHARPDTIFAYRRGRPISAEHFLRDVAALARLMPAHRHVLNLCADRYCFTLGLAAALCRQQVSLLPPNDTPGMLQAMIADFADLYCLTDGAPPAFAIPTMAFPLELSARPDAAAVPILPATQLALLLFTSGSTGRPKAAAKSWGALARSALAAGDRLSVRSLPGATVVGTVPHQHSYGLESTVLLALQQGLALQAERPFYPSDVVACLDAVPRPRILVTTPIHIRALLGESGPLPSADLIVSATAPLSKGLAAEAEARFKAPLQEIYGCSEAGQIATRRTAEGDAWQCLDGVALRQDEQGTWAAGAPVEAETLLHDIIELDGRSGFRLLGRTADLVNIAGKRGSLTHLDHQLTAIDGVVDGAFLMPDEGGDRVTRLVAFAVAPGLSPEAILSALRERIDPAFLPRPLIILDSLPRNSLGKLPREALLRLAARHGSR